MFAMNVEEGRKRYFTGSAFHLRRASVAVGKGSGVKSSTIKHFSRYSTSERSTH